MPARIPYYRPSHLPSAECLYRRTVDRREANRFYCSTRWRKLRAAFLAEHPLCADCLETGRVEPAVDVHHIRERRDFPDLAFEWDNLQPLCKRCHNGKRAP